MKGIKKLKKKKDKDLIKKNWFVDPDEDEPEHLHDPPFLKYIPHLWPGGGDCLCIYSVFSLGLNKFRRGGIWIKCKILDNR